MRTFKPDQGGWMARLPRFVLPGHPQHVIQRGNNRAIIFVSDEDYRFYLRKLHEACSKHGCDVHAYVLMTNHVHLLLTPMHENSISKMMQTLGRYYVQYFNSKYQRTGTLWEGRYKATLIDTDKYLFTCYRYIELNPVRAGMVEHPSDYTWSSYACNAYVSEDKLITYHPLYLKLSSCLTGRQDEYRKLFKHHIQDTVLEAIRQATNKSWALGSDAFKDQVEEMTRRQARPKMRGGHNKRKTGKSNRV